MLGHVAYLVAELLELQKNVRQLVEQLRKRWNVCFDLRLDEVTCSRRFSSSSRS